ncbi:unnamed protein product [Pleuronectes platessa]|uniref:Uncharacterized protein n=1 Tax=Pleuronectes platessa TaxID=8262 RepID=A0A9N7UI56_PLEPL|nr:unnamed protein product [Pleuronectes platessa]
MAALWEPPAPPLTPPACVCKQAESAVNKRGPWSIIVPPAVPALDVMPRTPIATQHPRVAKRHQPSGGIPCCALTSDSADFLLTLPGASSPTAAARLLLLLNEVFSFLSIMDTKLH